jgi:hypothetical protein
VARYRSGRIIIILAPRPSLPTPPWHAQRTFLCAEHARFWGVTTQAGAARSAPPHRSAPLSTQRPCPFSFVFGRGCHYRPSSAAYPPKKTRGLCPNPSRKRERPHSSCLLAAVVVGAAGWVMISQASCTKYWPPFAPWVQGGAGMGWVCSGGSNLAPVPLGSVAGDPVTPTPRPAHARGTRDQGWLLCPSPMPAAAGRGLGPHVFPAHRPWPQLQVQAASIMGRRPIVGIAHIQTG